MERITERKTSCWIKTKSGKDYTNYTQDWDAISKLAAYEDTGLTPPEIMELVGRDAAKAARPISDRSLYAIRPNCGQTIFRDYRFCPDCGQRLML